MTIHDEVAEKFGVNNFYQVLRVSYDASQDEIKKAYLKRSLELHPDKIADPNRREEFKRKFQVLSEIYMILGNTEKRIDYDKQFHYTNQSINTTDSTIYEDIPLNNCSEHEKFYSYNCRCSGAFILLKQNLLASQNITSTPHQNVFIVDCDSCSNSIKITH